MIFRRIIFNAIFVGLLTGILLSGVQLLGLTSIIFEAETYELVEEDYHHASSDDASPHEHSEEAWAPADGGERTFYTFVSNILAAIGFAALILSLMSQLQLQGVTKLSASKGLLWGVAGFAAFFIAPGLGLPPEIPGTEAAAIEQRQGWWILTVACVGMGLAVLAFAAVKLKVLGVLSIALPYFIGAPQIDGPEFSHPDPAAVEALTQLHHQFIIASGMSNLIFWVALGVACAWVLNKWVLNGVNASAA